MIHYRKEVSKFIMTIMRREYLILFFSFAIVCTLAVVTHADEKMIPGNERIEGKF